MSTLRLQTIQHYILLMILCLITTACSVSKEETLESVTTFFTGYQAVTTTPNTEIKEASFYLPSRFSIKEEVDYNVVLERGGQLFVLFHNPLEGKMSDIHIERDRKYQANSLIFEEKKSNDSYSYIIVTPKEEERLLVIVGVGGAKLSTLTTYENLQSDVGTMLEIVHSYDVK